MLTSFSSSGLGCTLYLSTCQRKALALVVLVRTFFFLTSVQRAWMACLTLCSAHSVLSESPFTLQNGYISAAADDDELVTLL